MLESPSEEDSPDLTDEQVASAVVTPSRSAYITALSLALEGLSFQKTPQHALRRRKPHLYGLTTVEFPDGTIKILVFQVDWLQGG